MGYLYDASPPGLLIALHLALLIWALTAYGAAVVAGIRALRFAYDGPPARPLCLVTDSTRWLFGWAMSPRRWRSRDFVALGIFLTIIACLMRAALLLEIMAAISLIKPATGYELRTAAIHVLTGSALIILHCGIALRFEKEAS